jgi:hypothetical protein
MHNRPSRHCCSHPASAVLDCTAPGSNLLPFTLSLSLSGILAGTLIGTLVGTLVGTTAAYAQAPAPTSPAPATSPAPSAPSELTSILAQIDTAASQGDLKAVMRFYSDAFTNTDGLTHDTLQQTLADLWKRYPGLTYSTTLDSWQPQGNGYSTVTTTTIQGEYPDERRDLGFTATITAQQQIEGNQIVQQQILSERSQLTGGENPPTLTINLPEQVTPGQEFSFDAVVAEPLGDRLLLGAAMEEPIGVENYLNPAPIELELLTSGGLFKVGEVPDANSDRWISAVIVRYDGITAVTQRLQVEGQ